MNGPKSGYMRYKKGYARRKPGSGLAFDPRALSVPQRGEVIFRVPKKRLDLLRPVLVETELHCEFSHSRANQIPHL